MERPASWGLVPFEEALSDEPFSVGKLKKADYAPTGRYPVVDQGQAFIAGYTDQEPLAYQGSLPVVVFGDHTRAFKFIDFPFVCDADGTKVLVPHRDSVDPYFFYLACTSLGLPSRGYSRHYRLLKERFLPLPPLPEQHAIAHVLRTVQQAREETEAVIGAARELKRSLMRHLFTYGPVSPVAATPGDLRPSEAGQIPSRWTSLPLDEAASFVLLAAAISGFCLGVWFGVFPYGPTSLVGVAWLVGVA
jgi:type I restriction enzyme S subunit